MSPSSQLGFLALKVVWLRLKFILVRGVLVRGVLVRGVLVRGVGEGGGGHMPLHMLDVVCPAPWVVGQWS